ncbi:hypothetical protein MA20_45140, partial [Bradyrhizobium japonicum]
PFQRPPYHSALIPGTSTVVMPGLVPGIHVLPAVWQRVDGRDKPGHDVAEAFAQRKIRVRGAHVPH